MKKYLLSLLLLVFSSPVYAAMTCKHLNSRSIADNDLKPSVIEGKCGATCVVTMECDDGRASARVNAACKAGQENGEWICPTAQKCLDDQTVIVAASALPTESEVQGGSGSKKGGTQ